MRIVTTSLPSLSLTDASFPHTLHDALSLAQTVPCSHGGDDLTFALVELLECEVDGRQLSDEIDLQRWSFHRVKNQWVLTEVLQAITVEAADSSLLVHGFSAALGAAQGGAKTLCLENSGETATIFYGFEWSFEDAGFLIAYVPTEILDVCKVEAQRLGYCLMT